VHTYRLSAMHFSREDSFWNNNWNISATFDWH